ncbi:MAG: hypothetical protein ACYC1L_02890 [Alphaproteobacteria bacterium]
MSVSKKGLMMAGAALALLGAVAIAVPVFTTSETKDVVKVGDVKITAKEETSHTVPPFLAWAGLGIGAVLIGAGLLRQS